MPGKWKPDQQKTDCSQAHGSRMSSESPGCCCGSCPCIYARLHWCWFEAFVFCCQYLMPALDSQRGAWVSFVPGASLGCRVGWIAVNNERESAFDLFICACLCLQELDGFLLCLHTVLTFCKFHDHVVIHSYTPCFHSLLLYCILTANSFICIPPPYSFTSFPKRLHGDDVRNPFWPSFPFSLPPSFHAFVCSYS